MTDRRWFEHTEESLTDESGYRGGVRGSWCSPPYDNIFIGSDPKDGCTKQWADQFQAVVNVSCTPCATFEPSRPDQRTYWFPTNELGQWPYAYFSWLFQVLEHHHGEGDRVYVHCHAGAYRSPWAVVLWLWYRGVGYEDAYLTARGWEDWPDDEFFQDEARQLWMSRTRVQENLPDNFELYLHRLRHHGLRYVESLVNPDYVSADPQVRLGSMKSTPLVDAARYLRSRRNKAKDWAARLARGQKEYRVSRGVSVIADGDRPVHEKIRRLRRRLGDALVAAEDWATYALLLWNDMTHREETTEEE